MVLILVETAQGYGLFKLEKDALAKASVEEIGENFETLKSAKKSVSLVNFTKFADVKEATSEVAALVEGKIGGVLKKVLKKSIVKAGLQSESLAVWDKNLATSIKKKFGLDVMLTSSVHEIFRGIKTHMNELVAELGKEESKVMSMSLSHSLSRFKLKFSPEKVDIMVIQAVGLVDDLDKELNNLAMRLKEWYGFHFPELLKLVSDNCVFAKLVRKIGYRNSVQKIESFDDLVTEDIEAQIRQAAETSMGSELVETDLSNINQLATRVLELADYRHGLTDYLRKRMEVLAPNLTHIVGETLGARLLAQAGSLMDLAKQPASTVQILGAEKALFRALKSKSSTPKYGLIFHAQLVGQAAPKIKGKMSRILANKITLCVRTDACGDQKAPSVAIGARAYCERRLDELSEETLGKTFSANRQSGTTQTPQYVPSRLRNANETPLKRYESANDQQGMPKTKKIKTESNTA